MSEIADSELAFREDIQNRIHTIRGVQVMLDSDLAMFYNVEVRRLNEQVKRNKERFPESFCFQLTVDEFEILKSQFATSSWGGRRKKPYAFTEPGVAMLSAVLRSDIAIKMSVQIIGAFVAMRRFIASNALVFQRLDSLELKQFDIDRKMERVLNALESGDVRPRQGIFFDGQVFDAHKFVSDLFRSAEESIVIIDNYLDVSVLAHLTDRKRGVQIHLLTAHISKSLTLDVEKFNAQYPPIDIMEFGSSHDRFIIIDSTDVYHLGASLKDLGKKWFAFSKMDIGALDVVARVEKSIAQ